MRLRIFVIDDEECVRETFKLHLEERGHEVMTAESPSSCPVYHGHDCQKDAPCGHALFIDFMHPEMSGLDFLEMMEKRGCKGASRHKFLMSGYTGFIDSERAEKIGCQVLQKPITLEQIDRIVDRIEAAADPEESLAVLH